MGLVSGSEPAIIYHCNAVPVAKPSRDAIMFIHKYHRQLNISSGIGCPPSIWKRAQGRGLKESRQTIRGAENRDHVASGEVLTRSIK